MGFILGFVAASALWGFGLLTVPRIKAWYASAKAKVDPAA